MRLGIDLGATNLRLVLVDENYKIIKKEKLKLPSFKSKEEFLDFLQKSIESFCNLKDINSIGIAAPGPFSKKGEIINPPNLPIKNLNLKKLLEKKLNKKVILINDVVSAAYAEYKLVLKERIKNLVFVSIGTGIGGGIIINGEILPRNAHEIGHIVVDFESPFKCGCGGKGHWEAISSGKNIPNVVEYFLKKRVSSKTFFENVYKKDPQSLKIFDYISKANAAGLATIINVYDPDIIIFGGGVCINNWNIIKHGILSHIENFKFLEVPELKITELKDLAGALGSVLIFDELD